MSVIGATSEMSYNILKLLQIFRQKLCLVGISLSKNFYLKKFESSNKSRGGGHFRNFWVGMCCCDPGTLNLYQS